MSRSHQRCLSFVLLGLLACDSFTRADDRKPAPADDFFTIVVLPDTQYYTEVQWKIEQYFKGQTQWIVDHRGDEHIAFVSHVGDLQQDGTFLRTDDHQSDPEVKELLVNIDPNNPPKNTRQWQRADEAMRIMDDADVPYVAVAGNHDFEHWGTIRNPVFYVEHFGPDRFAGKSWFGGGSPATAKMPAGVQSYQYFTAMGRKFLTIGLRFNPDAEDLAWAQQIIDQNPGLPTLITTHDYQNTKGRDGAGENIWHHLVKQNPQVFLVISGHVNGAHQQTSIDNAGEPVFEMLSDYQDYACGKKEGYDQDYAHGGAWMRLIRFYLQQNRIDVKTYSPVIKRFMTDKDNQFTVTCDF